MCAIWCFMSTCNCYKIFLSTFWLVSIFKRIRGDANIAALIIYIWTPVLMWICFGNYFWFHFGHFWEIYATVCAHDLDGQRTGPSSYIYAYITFVMLNAFFHTMRWLYATKPCALCRYCQNGVRVGDQGQWIIMRNFYDSYIITNFLKW